MQKGLYAEVQTLQESEVHFMTEIERFELVNRKEKAESMGADTILKYHTGYIDICKKLGVSGDHERNALDIAMYIINGLEKIYGAKCAAKVENVVYYYVCQSDMRAVCILVNELLEKALW